MTPQAIRHTLLLSSAIACTLVSVYHIFNLGRFTGFTMFNVQFVYLFMTLSVPLVFLLKPARLSRRDEQIPWYDFGLAGITVLCLAYFTAAADELNVTQGPSAAWYRHSSRTSRCRSSNARDGS